MQVAASVLKRSVGYTVLLDDSELRVFFAADKVPVSTVIWGHIT